jgi:hypothetical protein
MRRKTSSGKWWYKMLHDYDSSELVPVYAQEDDCYRYCLDLTEIRVQRLVLTYVDYVEQRYGIVNIGRTTYRSDKRGKSLRTMRKTETLVKIVDSLKGKDPAHFISFVFEIWEGRDHYDLFLKKDRVWSGVAYPSWQYILKNWHELVQAFLNVPNYQPKGFVPADVIDDRWRAAIEGRVSRWCAEHDSTVEQYWLEPKHWFPPYLTFQEIPFAQSLWDNREVVEKKMGSSLEDLQYFLFDLHQEPVNLPISRMEDI